MKILFLDQSGKLGGAELSLLDVADFYKTNCLVGLFADGVFRETLEVRHIPVQVLTRRVIQVNKEGSFLQGLSSLGAIAPLIFQVAQIARHYDCIYANTQKAFVVGALASVLSRRPLVYHLRDILSSDHFSFANRAIAVTLANQFASLVITNSQATRAAFIEAGGRADITDVVYNGFDPAQYQYHEIDRTRIRQELGLKDHFIIGHFSRLSPWKGQHILIEALADCPSNTTALLVGDALFGEQDYREQLHRQVARLGLEHRVQFLGFRSDVAQLMAACDVVVHTSTAPEPFGRVIVESMLCGRPTVAAEAGGAVELIEHCKTGWLSPPGDAQKLAELILFCYDQPQQAAAIAKQAQRQASQRFSLTVTNQQIAQHLNRVAGPNS